MKRLAALEADNQGDKDALIIVRRCFSSIKEEWPVMGYSFGNGKQAFKLPGESDEEIKQRIADIMHTQTPKHAAVILRPIYGEINE